MKLKTTVLLVGGSALAGLGAYAVYRWRKNKRLVLEMECESEACRIEQEIEELLSQEEYEAV